MASKGKKKRSLRDLSIGFPTGEEAKQAFEELLTLHDRAAAILAGSYVENALRTGLLHALPNNNNETTEALMDRNGPLASLFPMVHLAYALNLIPAHVRNDIEIIRRVRNAFAHSASNIDFETPEVSRECMKLTIIKMPELLKEMKSQYPNQSTERVAYVSVCMGVAARLMALAVEKLIETRTRLEEQLRRLKGSPPAH